MCIAAIQLLASTALVLYDNVAHWQVSLVQEGARFASIVHGQLMSAYFSTRNSLGFIYGLMGHPCQICCSTRLTGPDRVLSHIPGCVYESPNAMTSCGTCNLAHKQMTPAAYQEWCAIQSIKILPAGSGFL